MPDSPPVMPSSPPCSLAGSGVCRIRRGMWLMVTVALMLAADSFSKQYAMTWLKETQTEPIVYLNGLLRIQYAENPGAFLSLLAGVQSSIRFWTLTVANGAILAGLAVFLLASRSLDRWTWFALSLILAGGIGNLIDRIAYGHVIDFLNIGIGNLRTGIFNIADIGITTGFVLLLPKVFSSRSTTDPGTRESASPQSVQSENAA